MPSRIYYPLLSQSPPIFELPAKQAQHVRVLRCNLGDALEVFNGKGHFAEAHIIHLDKKSVQLELKALQIATQAETYPVHLIQALTRNETMDWIIQKATELGVKSITPIMSERTQGRLKADQLNKKMLHWQEIIISAAEQSQLNFLPILKEALTLENYLAAQNEHAPPLFIFDPQSSHSFHDLRTHPKACQIMIGPEGGFTPAEVKMALTHHAQSLRLHQNILRAETAAITALSLCQFHFGP
jgi:16S rRNA (uracil1498-N3)-methyltransferase